MNLKSSFLSELGVLDWGYTEDPLSTTYDRYEEWVSQGHSQPLGYLSDHRKELRSDLRSVYPAFQSALVFLFSYRPTKKWLLENNRHQVAAYALGFEGEDYHYALKKRLLQIHQELLKEHPGAEAFVSLDAQPVLERDLAYRAGLGWFGKNSMLISRREGSYFIIGSLLLNKKIGLPVKGMDIDHCGTCTACADACPTKAIDVETRTLRAADCISTFTIEIMQDATPPEGYDRARGEVFGCDICQDVCPWNRRPLERDFALLRFQEQFTSLSRFLELSKEELRSEIEQMTGRGFQRSLSGTALSRPGKKGWLKNLKS